MVNIIWALLIIVGIVFSIFKGDFSLLSSTILESSKSAINVVLDLLPLLAFWLGLMKIAEDSGLLQKISKFFEPILRKLFPELPRNSQAFGYIASNVSMNMLGLGNAATPMGLKAMDEMQKENDEKNTASNSMITFLVLNTTGLTIMPTTVIALRLTYGSINPTGIIVPVIIATFIATIAGLLLDRFFRRKSLRKRL